MSQRKPKTRRIANQAARTKLLHKVLADGAQSLLIRYRKVDLEDLSRVLARAHTTTPDRVKVALGGDPRFEVSGNAIVLRGWSDRRASTSRSQATAKPSLLDEVRFALTETDTDRVLVMASASGTTRTLRCDFVRGDRGEEVWIATAVTNPEDWIAASRAGAWSLRPGWKLPLVKAAEVPGGAPMVLVYREASAADAAQRVQAVVAELWDVQSGTARLEKVTCSPAELERRVLGEHTVRRLVARATPRGPTVKTCERCGQPLTDPSSVALGIGPECRKYYSTEVLRAVKARSKVIPKMSAQKPTSWAKAIREWLSTDY